MTHEVWQSKTYWKHSCQCWAFAWRHFREMDSRDFIVTGCLTICTVLFTCIGYLDNKPVLLMLIQGLAVTFGGAISWAIVLLLWYRIRASSKINHVQTTKLSELKEGNEDLQSQLDSLSFEHNTPNMSLPEVLEYCRRVNCFGLSADDIFANLSNLAAQGKLRVWAQRCVSRLFDSPDNRFDSYDYRQMIVDSHIFNDQVFYLPPDSSERENQEWSIVKKEILHFTECEEGEIQSIGGADTNFIAPKFLRSEIEVVCKSVHRSR